MQETERCLPGGNFGQGDILRFEGIEKPVSYSRGIIINADCDLENNKLDGVIAYLPLYTFKEYLENFWIKIFVSQIKNNLIKRIFDLCRLEDSTSSNITELIDWISQGEATDIATKLSSQYSIKQKEFDVLRLSIYKLQQCINPTSSTLDQFHIYCSWEKDPAAFALKHLTAAKISMGDDHFFLSEIIGENEIGFVVRMRRIYTINVQQCFTSTSEQLKVSDENIMSAIRIAKLSTLYQFKIAQIFALQYSRIGLPNEAATLNSLVLDTLALDLSKKKI